MTVLLAILASKRFCLKAIDWVRVEMDKQTSSWNADGKDRKVKKRKSHGKV